MTSTEDAKRAEDLRGLAVWLLAREELPGMQAARANAEFLQRATVFLETYALASAKDTTHDQG